MRKLTGILSFVLAVALMAGTAMAWNFDDHVVVAPNSEGDVLIFPAYVAASPYETTFYVTNTSNVNSVVAKVVFWGGTFTEELRDFFIFLSPNDMFKATIRDDNGVIRVTSTDDSVLAGVGAGNAPIWGNEQQMSTTLSATCETLPGLGYIEVFEVAYYNYPKTNGVVDKTLILDGYGGIQGLNSSDVIADNVTFSNMNLTVANPQGIAPNGMYVGTLNVLAGHEVVTVADNALAAAMRPTVLRNYDTSLTRKATLLAKTTFFGDQGAQNSVEEVEAALIKDELQMPFKSDNTFHIFTFPTKITGINTTNCNVTGWQSEYFRDLLGEPSNTNNCAYYLPNFYDMSENTTEVLGGVFSPIGGDQTTVGQFCGEVNVSLQPAYPFDEGWARYTFTDAGGTSPVVTAGDVRAFEGGVDDIQYEGAPVIGTVLDFGLRGGSADAMTMMEAAYRDGDVYELTTAGAVQYYYYQYWDAMHFPNADGDPVSINFGYRSDEVPVFPWPTTFTGVADGDVPAW